MHVTVLGVFRLQRMVNLFTEATTNEQKIPGANKEKTFFFCYLTLITARQRYVMLISQIFAFNRQSKK